MQKQRHWIRWVLIALIAFVFIFSWKSFLGPKVYVPNVLFGLEEGSAVPVGYEAKLKIDLDDLDPSDRNILLQTIDQQKINPSKENYDRYTTMINQYPDHERLFLYILRSELLRPQSDENKINFLKSWLYKNDSLAKVLSKEPEILFLQAKLYQALSSWGVLDTLSEALVQKAPQYAMGRSLRGEVYLQKCMFPQARLELKTSLSLSSPKERALTYARLAESYLYSASSDSGLLILDNALKIYPTDPNLLLSYANWREYKGEIGLARSAYEKLAGLYPAEQKYRFLLQNLGKNNVGVCRKIVDTKPQVANNSLTMVESNLQSYLTKYPDDLGLRLALARILIESGKLEDAKIQITEVLKIDSTNLDADTLSRMAQSTQQNAPEKVISVVSDDKQNTKSSQKSSDFGVYLVSWGSSPAQFFQNYPQNQFSSSQANLFDHRIETQETREIYRLDFTQGFWRVSGIVQSKKNGFDLLGRILHQKALLSGDPNVAENQTCGKAKFNTFLWENSEITELVFQNLAQTDRVGILRVSPKKIGSSGICDLIKMVQ